MGWILGPSRQCIMPANSPRGLPPPDHRVGDYWRCTDPGCGKLWRLTGGRIWWFWQEATWREIRRYKNQGWEE